MVSDLKSDKGFSSILREFEIHRFHQQRHIMHIISASRDHTGEVLVSAERDDGSALRWYSATPERYVSASSPSIEDLARSLLIKYRGQATVIEREITIADHESGRVKTLESRLKRCRMVIENALEIVPETAS